MTESKNYMINFPWVPDMVQAYKFGLCELCEKEKIRDKKFDNSMCPHCKKMVKCFSWMKGDDTALVNVAQHNS